jgi:hypothetical protein
VWVDALQKQNSRRNSVADVRFRGFSVSQPFDFSMCEFSEMASKTGTCDNTRYRRDSAGGYCPVEDIAVRRNGRAIIATAKNSCKRQLT